MASLHDGVIKRGRSWSYVIRVTDPLTGVSRPRWVGGHATEAEAKAARDKARQRARRGEYVDRSSITVEEYLSSWLVAHSRQAEDLRGIQVPGRSLRPASRRSDEAAVRQADAYQLAVPRAAGWRRSKRKAVVATDDRCRSPGVTQGVQRRRCQRSGLGV